MGLRAGLLREQIVVKRRTVTRNDYGEEVDTWTDVLTTRARVDFRSGTRMVDVNEVADPHTVTFIVRLNVQVNVYDRIEWRGRLYSVQSVNEEVTRQQITILAQVINE